MGSTATEPVIDDRDPLAVELPRLAPGDAAPKRVVPWHVRLGLSWASGSTPVVLLLLIGVALGPQALNILTPAVVSALDPALPVALAALGAHVALTLPLRAARRDHLVLAGASVEALVTALVVSAGTLILLWPDFTVPSFSAWVIALGAGLSAAMSAGLTSETSGVAASHSGVRQLDVLLPTVLGGLLLAWVREGSAGGTVLMALQGVGLALLVAVAAWLLLARVASQTEGRIFGVAALLLVGGVADYLSLSALLSGLVAGTFWRLTGGQAADVMRRDLGGVQHLLLVLMLVVAGARTEISAPAAGLAVAYLALRTAGKLGGVWVAGRWGLPLPPDVGMALLPPGVFGIAFALNTVRAAEPQADPLLAMTVIGTILSQLLLSRRLQERHE